MTISAKLFEFQSRFEAFQTFLTGAVKGNRDILYERSIRTFPSSNFATHENRIKDNLGRDLYSLLGNVYIETLYEIPSGMTVVNNNLSYSLMIYKNGILLDQLLDYNILIQLGTMFVYFHNTFVNSGDEFTYVIRKIITKTSDLSYVTSDTQLTIAKSAIENFQEINDLMLYDNTNSKPLTGYRVMETTDKVIFYDLPIRRSITLYNSNHFYIKRITQNIPRSNETGIAVVQITNDPIPVKTSYELEVYKDGLFLVPEVDFKLVDGRIQIKISKSDIRTPTPPTRTSGGLASNRQLVNSEISPLQQSSEAFSVLQDNTLFQVFHFRPLDVGYELDENDYLQTPISGGRTFKGEFGYLDFINDTQDESCQYFPLENKGKFILDSILPFSPENLNIFSNGLRVAQDRISVSSNKINAFAISTFLDKEKVFIQATLGRSKNIVLVNQLNMFSGLIETDTYIEASNFDKLCLVIMHRYVAELEEKLVVPDLPYYPYIDASINHIDDTVA